MGLPVASVAGGLKTHDLGTAWGNVPRRVDVRRNMPDSLKQAGSRQGVLSVRRDLPGRKHAKWPVAHLL